MKSKSVSIRRLQRFASDMEKLAKRVDIDAALKGVAHNTAVFGMGQADGIRIALNNLNREIICPEKYLHLKF